MSKKSKNCKKKDGFKVKAEAACPLTCGTCELPAPAPTPFPTDGECFDSASWYWKKSKYDCDYVAKKSKRCKSKYADEYDVSSSDACPVACGECEAACADSTSWYWKKSKNDCEYVATKSKRCKSKYTDESDVPSAGACPVACGTC